MIHLWEAGSLPQLCLLHHVNTPAVRTDPGWTVCYTPGIFCKTLRADHEAAVAAPAKGLFLLAAVADIFSAVTAAVGFFLCHFFPISVS